MKKIKCLSIAMMVLGCLVLTSNDAFAQKSHKVKNPRAATKQAKMLKATPQTRTKKATIKPVVLPTKKATLQTKKPVLKATVTPIELKTISIKNLKPVNNK